MSRGGAAGTRVAALVAMLSVCCGLLGCGGTVATPMVQVPLFQRRGQGEAGFVMGPGSRRPELGGTLRYAATDQLRVGGSVSGASGPALVLGGRDARDQAPKLFADGFLGAEWGGFALRFGALLGSGYGVRVSGGAGCTSRLGSESACTVGASPTLQTRFVRSYGQLHMGFAPPGPLAVSLALRVPVIVELDHPSAARSTEVSTEVALTQTVRFRHLRLDLQPLWSRTRGFAFHLALLFRFDAGEP